jgi:3-hydroxyacyl-[acyl-carrier-protein] dehydratase
MIETMAQVSSFATYPYIHKIVEKHPGSYQCILVGVDNARFRKPVVPGDTLRIESVVTKCRARLWAFSCTISVDGQKVAEADLMANLIPTLENVS